MPALASGRSFRPGAGVSGRPGAPRRLRRRSRACRRPSGEADGQCAFLGRFTTRLDRAGFRAGAVPIPVPAQGRAAPRPRPAGAHAPALRRHWRARPRPPPRTLRVTQKAPRLSEVKMAARASGETAAVGGLGWSCGAAPVALAALSSLCPRAGRRGGP